MIAEINMSLKEYIVKWQVLVSSRDHKTFFESLCPTAIGWKVEDRGEYNRRLNELHDAADLIVEKRMNGRWIAKIHLKNQQLEGGMSIIKLMERRPGSGDVAGLDHVDFFIPEQIDLKTLLSKEKDLKWSEESNNVLAGYNWISLWFDNTEAKLKFDTVLDIIRTELKELNYKVISK